ncbi:DTDP-glucose 4,6-dehydratase, partial [mine drainage metagenome]
PEKLIPTVVLAAIEGKDIPLYGDGLNIRDWLYVGDHIRAIRRIHEAGTPGETYNIGGNSERTNRSVINTILSILDRERPRSDGHSYSEQVKLVTDRPGHDRRYAMDASRLMRELDWTPEFSFESAIGETVRWYLANEKWWKNIRSQTYSGERLGVLSPSERGEE